MTGPTRPTGPLTWTDLAREVRDRRAALRERTAWFQRLNAQQHALGMAEAIGTTAERWRPARQDLAAAGSLLETWRRRLAVTDRLLDGRRDRKSLEGLTELLYGDTITLTPAQAPMVEHRPPAAESSAPHYSLPQVTEFVDDSLRTVESLLGAVAEVHAIAERLTALRAALDPAGGPGSDPADPPGIRASVDDVRAGARSDPLAVPPESATALELTLARLRCARLASAINRLEAREIHAREQLANRSSIVDMSSVPQAAAGLHEVLDDLERRCEGERRSDPAALAELARRIAAADERARRAGAPVCVRPDCRGGTLDESGICPTCFRAPRSREAG